MQRIVAKCGRFYRTIPRTVNTSINNYNKSVPFLQYSSTSQSIGSKTLLNNRDDKGIERTVLKRNVVQSSETKDCSQIESINFFADEHIIQINFTDGQTLNFNTFWLRDSCVCPQCVHPLTRAKLLDCADISADLFVDRIDFSNQFVDIQWRSVSNEEHISQYSISWLSLFRDVFDANLQRIKDSNIVMKSPNDGLYDSRIPKPERILWDSTQIDRQKITFDYNDLMNDSNEFLRHYLQLFYKFGVVLLENVPIESNIVLSVAKRIADERKTSYGSSFEISGKEQPNARIAYSGNLLNSHVDLAYREKSPGVQLLHCLEHSSVGCALTLVDGYVCAQTLKDMNPENFKFLSENPVLFAFCDNTKGVWIRQKWPIISLNSQQMVNAVHYSSVSMRPPLLPSNLLDLFYESYRKLTKLIRDERFLFRLSLRPGDLVMIDNRRVLHTWDESHLFTIRHLEICYLDFDEVIALYEKLISC